MCQENNKKLSDVIAENCEFRIILYVKCYYLADLAGSYINISK